MDNFIREYHNSLSADFCEHVINKFEQDPRKIRGRSAGGWDEEIKKSTDLLITNYWEWAEEDKHLHSALSEPLTDFVNDVASQCHQYVGNSLDTGYNIQRTEPGEFYRWHNDAAPYANTSGTYLRIITFIWYLNDITEGGETEFKDGTKIKPEAGKLLLFPATWVHAHRGVSPVRETKYIVTGWIHELY